MIPIGHCMYVVSFLFRQPILDLISLSAIVPQTNHRGLPSISYFFALTSMNESRPVLLRRHSIPHFVFASSNTFFNSYLAVFFTLCPSLYLSNRYTRHLVNSSFVFVIFLCSCSILLPQINSDMH